MQYIENIVLDVELVDDGTLDRVVNVHNSLTDRTATFRYDAESFDEVTVLEQAKNDYLDQLVEFLSHHSDF